MPFLHDCAEAGLLKSSEFLLRNGAEIDMPGIGGRTPLWAASARGHDGVVEMLVGENADVAIRDDGGEMPLHVALRHGHWRCYFILIRETPLCVYELAGHTT